VIFLTGSTFQSGIEDIGATFTPLQGIANFSIANINSLFPPPDKVAPPLPGPATIAYVMQYIFVSTIPDSHKSVQDVLQQIKENDSQTPR
jgi:hypothetical protein